MRLTKHQVWLLTAIFGISFFGILPFSHRYGCLLNSPCEIVAGPPFVIALLLVTVVYIGSQVYNQKSRK
jgi:hypothetical protein